MKTRCFTRGNENQGVHVEFSVRHHPLQIPIPMLAKKIRTNLAFLPQQKNWHNRTTVLYTKYVRTKNYFPPD